MKPPRDLMRTQYLTLWIFIDQRLALSIEEADGSKPEHSRYPYLVTIVNVAEAAVEVRDGPTRWTPRVVEAENERNPSRRLDRLMVELGIPGLDQIYTLYLARKTPDSARFGGMSWTPVMDDAPLSAVQLIPEVGASYAGAMFDDLGHAEALLTGWAEPYANFRTATEAEQTRYSHWFTDSE